MAAGTGISGFGVTLVQATNTAGLTSTSYIGELRDFSGPEGSGDTADITHNTSPSGVKEFAPGLWDEGELSVDGVWTATTITTLRSLIRTKTYWRINLPDAASTKISFQGILTGLGWNIPMNEAVSTPIKIKLSGPVTVS